MADKILHAVYDDDDKLMHAVKDLRAAISQLMKSTPIPFMDSF